MVAPRSRNPLFNRVPDYQRVPQTRANAVPPTWYMPKEWHGRVNLPDNTFGQPGSAQNPLRRPADSGVPGAGYDQVAAAAAVLGRMAENPVSGSTPPKPPSPRGLIQPGGGISGVSG